MNSNRRKRRENVDRRSSMKRRSALVSSAYLRTLFIGVGISLFIAAGYLLLQEYELIPDRLIVDRVVLDDLSSQQSLEFTLTLYGDTNEVDKQQIEEVVKNATVDGMLALDVVALQKSLEKLPWIYSVKARRVLPDKIDVWITEQQPVVIWGDRGYLNVEGELFEPASFTLANAKQKFSLPTINAPLNVTQQQNSVSLYNKFDRFKKILLEDVSSMAIIEQMVVDKRGAIHLLLTDGLELNLGRRWMERRLTRWVKHSKVILERFNKNGGGEVKLVDLRYERGVAIEFTGKG